MKSLNEVLKEVAHRVVIDKEGRAVSKDRAEREYNIVPDIIFIRDDGWTLGSPFIFEDVAYELWKDQWKGFIRISDGKVKNIEEYIPFHSSLGPTGKFPEGKLNEDDEGELAFAVGNYKNKVMLTFNKPITWLGMLPEQAKELANLLIQHADACS